MVALGVSCSVRRRGSAHLLNGLIWLIFDSGIIEVSIEVMKPFKMIIPKIRRNILQVVNLLREPFHCVMVDVLRSCLTLIDCPKLASIRAVETRLQIKPLAFSSIIIRLCRWGGMDVAVTYSFVDLGLTSHSCLSRKQFVQGASLWATSQRTFLFRHARHALAARLRCDMGLRSGES